MRVALSASHGGCGECIEVLRTCDIIYTTQFNNIQLLRELFPNTEILPIPDGRSDTVEFLKRRHENDEVVTLGNLITIRAKQWDESKQDYFDRVNLRDLVSVETANKYHL